MDVGGLELGVIGDAEPVGLCGSGLVDAVAELVRLKLIDSTGRFVPDEEAARIAPGLARRLTVVGSSASSSSTGAGRRATRRARST